MLADAADTCHVLEGCSSGRHVVVGNTDARCSHSLSPEPSASSMQSRAGHVSHGIAHAATPPQPPSLALWLSRLPAKQGSADKHPVPATLLGIVPSPHNSEDTLTTQQDDDTDAHCISSPHSPLTTMPPEPKRQRVTQACKACRDSKLRCDLGDARAPKNPPCERCLRTGRTCDFVGSHLRCKPRKMTRRASVPASTSGPSSVPRGSTMRSSLHEAGPSAM